jgi:hypothetical protein
MTDADRVELPDPEWRSYVDEEQQEAFELPDPFATPPPDPHSRD